MTSSPAPASVSRTAWLVVILLMPVALLNYLDRQLLAVMRDSVMTAIPDLGQAENRDVLWGLMLGQFKWVYAFCSPLGGYIADRLSRRYTICGSLFVWSFVTWWTGQVTTYNELLWARSLMGVSEAFYIPAALALITDYHTGTTRSRAVGLHQLAIYCGVITGGFGGYVASAPNLGWRFAFDACGAVGMLYALPLLYFLRDPSSLRVSSNTLNSANRSTKPSPIQAGIELFTNRSFLLLVLYFTLPAMAAWIVRDWMPAIFKAKFDIGQGKAGVAATLFWQVAAIVAAVGGGWLADFWMRKNQRGRIYTSALGMALIAPAILGIGNADTLFIAVLFLILFGLGWGFYDCNNMPILSQIVRPELRATGYGIMNFASISCGGFADIGFGKMLHHHVPNYVIFGILAVAALVSIALVLLIRPKPELIPQDQPR